eukprot:Rhum_TRINITY_DN13204_c0_g1::Rhum_TRINITY_DN13204_c0_g1_i2::g.58059::m.58059
MGLVAWGGGGGNMRVPAYLCFLVDNITVRFGLRQGRWEGGGWGGGGMQRVLQLWVFLFFCVRCVCFFLYFLQQKFWLHLAYKRDAEQQQTPKWCVVAQNMIFCVCVSFSALPSRHVVASVLLHFLFFLTTMFFFVQLCFFVVCLTPRSRGRPGNRALGRADVNGHHSVRLRPVHPVHVVHVRLRVVRLDHTGRPGRALPEHLRRRTHAQVRRQRRLRHGASVAAAAVRLAARTRVRLRLVGRPQVVAAHALGDLAGTLEAHGVRAVAGTRGDGGGVPPVLVRPVEDVDAVAGAHLGARRGDGGAGRRRMARVAHRVRGDALRSLARLEGDAVGAVGQDAHHLRRVPAPARRHHAVLGAVEDLNALAGAELGGQVARGGVGRHGRPRGDDVRRPRVGRGVVVVHGAREGVVDGALSLGDVALAGHGDVDVDGAGLAEHLTHLLHVVDGLAVDADDEPPLVAADVLLEGRHAAARVADLDHAALPHAKHDARGVAHSLVEPQHRALGQALLRVHSREAAGRVATDARHRRDNRRGCVLGNEVQIL